MDGLRSIASELFGREVSATTVSKAASHLDGEINRYQIRLLSYDLPFL